MRLITAYSDIVVKNYKGMAENLVKTAELLGYKTSIYRIGMDIKYITVKESIPDCAFKPKLIRRALDEHNEDILFVDADCLMQKSFNDIDADVMVTLRRLGDRDCTTRPVFDGYINAGVVFCKNNDKARKFLDRWERQIVESESDQMALNVILLRYDEMKHFDVIDVDGIRVFLAPAEEFNCFYIDKFKDAIILHFKEDWMLGSYDFWLNKIMGSK